MSDTQADVLDWLSSHDDFAIASHADPDGDSLGSSLALALALEQAGKHSLVVLGQPLPPRYAWLPESSRVTTVAEVPRTARACILVECSDFARAGVPGLERLASLNIDHHTQNALFADVNWIDPSVAATGQMIRMLLADLGAQVTPAMATLLYVTVLTDTGSFHHSNTDAAALAFAADMVAAGANASEIAEAVYGNVPAGRVQLLGDALSTLTFGGGGRIATMVLRDSDFRRRGTRDTEGLINHAQDIEGVSVSLLLKEADAGLVRVSLRSDGSVDVADLASTHGGGGHPRAAGCQLAGDLDTVRAGLVAEIIARLG